jgi:PAS domain S-box-containing protein
MLDEQMSKEELIKELSILRRALSEYKRTEQSRLEGDVYFRVMADHAPVLIWMSGPDKLCTYFNKRWLEFTGRVLEEEIGNGWAEGVHPDDLNRCLEFYTKAFDARQDFQMEYRLRNAKNEYRWVLDQGMPMFAADGTFTGYIGSCVDVTDHMLAMEELHFAEERLRLVSKATNDVVWDWNLAANILYWGTNFEILFGYSLSEIEPGIESWHYRLHPEDHDRVIAGIHEALVQRQNNWSDQYRFKCKDGSYVDVFDRGYVIFGEDGKPVRMVGAMLDVTERKKSEYALQESEMRFRVLSENSPVGIFQTDNEGRCLYVNLKYTEITGMSFQDAKGEGWSRGLHTDDRKYVFDAWQEWVKGGKEFSLEYRFMKPDGKIVWVLGVAFALRNDKNEIIGFIGDIVDITERKLSECEMKKNIEELKLLLAITVDRENTMIDLKKEVNALAQELKLAPPHDLSFLSENRAAL